MSAVNAFLKDFMEMRKALTPQGPAGGAKIVGKPEPANPDAKKRKAKFKKEQDTENTSLMTIIEKKPHRRDVIHYLQERANEFTTQKMA